MDAAVQTSHWHWIYYVRIVQKEVSGKLYLWVRKNLSDLMRDIHETVSNQLIEAFIINYKFADEGNWIAYVVVHLATKILFVIFVT